MEPVKSIMIVDDSLIDQMITTMALKNSKAAGELVVMKSALDALAYLDQRVDCPEQFPYLILLDLDMPEMNGIGFLNRFNQYADSLKEICRIVVLTASDVLTDIEAMKSHPRVSQLISKPLDKDALSFVV